MTSRAHQNVSQYRNNVSGLQNPEQHAQPFVRPSKGELLFFSKIHSEINSNAKCIILAQL